MQIDREKILNFIRLRGPVLPVQLSNEFKQSTIIIGAVLSELVKTGKIEISYLKVGGSPVYFLKEQRYKLQEYKKYLNEKDLRAYELLRQKKVLMDRTLNPLMRVCMRQIKDFAHRLIVEIKGKKEVFWKWYLLGDDDAERIIKGIINGNAGLKEKGEKEEKEEIKKTYKAKEAEEEKAMPREQATEKKESREEAKKPAAKEVQKKIIEEEAKKSKTRKEEGRFYLRVKEYFEKRKIRTIKEETIRKNSDMEFIVWIPTSVGTIKCFLKAKKKNKINEADLASAYVRAQYLGLPLIYLSTGKLTKKAIEKAGKELKNIKFISI